MRIRSFDDAYGRKGSESDRIHDDARGGSVPDFYLRPSAFICVRKGSGFSRVYPTDREIGIVSSESPAFFDGVKG